MSTARPYVRAVLAVCTAAFLFVSAHVQAAGRYDEAVSASTGAESVAAIVEVVGYWSAERMAAAKPMPMPSAESGARSAGEEPKPSGPAFMASSARPAERVVERWVSQEELQASMPEWGTFPWNYTRYRLFPSTNTMYQTFPYSTVGKLFFTIPGQGNFVCSGASEASNNKSVVWTAGHCVYSPGIGWHTNFLFVPGRRAGTNPFGSWTVLQAWTLVGWQSNFLEYDMGALVMNRGGTSNLHINNAVGGLGFLANAARGQHWHLHGYPAAARDLASTPPGAQFNGEHHELCAATWAANDLGGNGPATLGVGCDKTGGTSGGPWTVDFSGVGGFTNLLNSNNSYRYTGGPPNNLRLFGPYFGTGAINLRNSAQAVVVP